MTAYFIAGTGTDIGKTFTTCALIHAGNARGLKPVISGGTADSEALVAAMGQGDVEAISPWRFTAPLSPDMAAAREGRSLDFGALVEWTRAQLTAPLTFIETAGGVLSPLTETHSMADWMVALQLPVILVAGSYLGSISHTLSAIEALQSRGLTIAALVINETAGSPVPLAETKTAIARRVAGIPLLVGQRFVSSYREAQEIHALRGTL